MSYTSKETRRTAARLILLPPETLEAAIAYLKSRENDRLIIAKKINWETIHSAHGGIMDMRLEFEQALESATGHHKKRCKCVFCKETVKKRTGE